LALVLHVFLIFLVMIPSAGARYSIIVGLPVFYVFLFWVHVAFGVVAGVLGFVVVGFWVSKTLSQTGCIRVRKAMMPIFIMWMMSLLSGEITHILGVF
jgi:hypothetical protein